MPGGEKYSTQGKQAKSNLMFNFDPSNYGLSVDGGSGSKWLSPGLKEAIEGGTEFGGYYQGAPGVGTFTSDNRYLEPGTEERLPTIMPGYEQLANYDTLFENYDQGNLPATQSNILNSYQNVLTGNVADGGGYFTAEALSGIGVGGGAGGGGGVPAPPDFANRTLNVDNVGAIVGDIFDDMPPEFQNFTINMLNAADPTQVEAQINDFMGQMTDYATMQAADMGRATMDKFASEGLGTSGAAVAGMMDIATRVATESSVRVSEYALERYNQIIKQQGIAQQIQSDYLQTGATEQANRIQYEMSKLQAEANAYGSYAAAQASVQSSLANANAQIQSQLIASSGQLEQQRMQLMGQSASEMFAENQVVNQQNTDALMLPYGIAREQEQLKRAQGGGGSFPIGEIISGAATVGAAVI